MKNFLWSVVLEAAYSLEKEDINREEFFEKLCRHHGFEPKR